MVERQDTSTDVAPGDLAGWGGFATVLAALLALATGAGWMAAFGLCCLGGVTTATLCWAAGARTRARAGDDAAHRPG